MKSLNELYNESCEPKYVNYKQISSHITLIDNFFKDFDKARNFFINREKWKCTLYQGHSKPGYESLFPSWIAKSLIQKYVLDNKISDDMNSYRIVCNFFHHSQDYIWSVSNSNYFPHIDSVQIEGTLNYICLINLNECPVSTKFYSYKNKEYCSSEMILEWDNYDKKIQKELIKYYNKENITRNEVKLFLDNQKLDVKLIKKIEYNPNQAIVYPANLFHSPNVTEKFTETNPRILLRIDFDRKIIKPKNINYA